MKKPGVSRVGRGGGLALVGLVAAFLAGCAGEPQVSDQDIGIGDARDLASLSGMPEDWGGARTRVGRGGPVDPEDVECLALTMHWEAGGRAEKPGSGRSRGPQSRGQSAVSRYRLRGRFPRRPRYRSNLPVSMGLRRSRHSCRVPGRVGDGDANRSRPSGRARQRPHERCAVLPFCGGFAEMV